MEFIYSSIEVVPRKTFRFSGELPRVIASSTDSGVRYCRNKLSTRRGPSEGASSRRSTRAAWRSRAAVALPPSRGLLTTDHTPRGIVEPNPGLVDQDIRSPKSTMELPTECH